ncbi:voltage-dependent calcium channel gamma-8 subunit-like isoform X3 [Sphaerodactylus townsendi]|uniref:voltage-dependent calcium channel gamma-8 subunit-like isoform X3 n=1 Tax=Sphaerodactylus townsendi TaxID=933632 RepID=UPI002025E9FB|nr:voltage-dependent calcium channel gamma-8 subunit-like isoform X3 [Sphaerodactylus townsendi]
MKLGSGTGVGAFRGLLPGVAGGGALKKVRGGASAGGAQGDGGGGGCRGRVEASGWGLGGGGQPRMDGGPATATDPRVRQDGPVGGAKRPGAPAREAPAAHSPVEKNTTSYNRGRPWFKFHLCSGRHTQQVQAGRNMGITATARSAAQGQRQLNWRFRGKS